jgi:hypothetical protein
MLALVLQHTKTSRKVSVDVDVVDCPNHNDAEVRDSPNHTVIVSGLPSY